VLLGAGRGGGGGGARIAETAGDRGRARSKLERSECLWCRAVQFYYLSPWFGNTVHPHQPLKVQSKRRSRGEDSQRLLSMLAQQTAESHVNHPRLTASVSTLSACACAPRPQGGDFLEKDRLQPLRFSQRHLCVALRYQISMVCCPKYPWMGNCLYPRQSPGLSGG
jgi:hypothetical protein